MVPPELRRSMLRTLECVIDFILDSLDDSPEETTPPKSVDEVKVKMAFGGGDDPLAIILWNDEKHSFDEVAYSLMELIGCSKEEGLRLAELIDSEVRLDHLPNISFLC
jgi:E3 ubiquitin-protein ligase UBR1